MSYFEADFYLDFIGDGGCLAVSLESVAAHSSLEESSSLLTPQVNRVGFLLGELVQLILDCFGVLEMSFFPTTDRDFTSSKNWSSASSSLPKAL